MSTLPPGVKRQSIPFLVKDLVSISDPDLIRTVATNPDLTRPGEAELPWAVRLLVKSSVFQYPRKNRWSVNVLADKQDNYPARRVATEAMLAKGFTAEQKQKLANLVSGNQNEEQVKEEVYKIFAELLEVVQPGETLPQEIAEALRKLPGVTPLGYLNGRASRRKLEDYLEKKLPPGAEVVDFMHHLWASAGFANALISMRDMPDGVDEKAYFLDNPVITDSFRMPKRSTTLGDIFPADSPIKPGAIVILRNGPACQETKDDRFFFGVGLQERQCPFKNVFFNTITELR